MKSVQDVLKQIHLQAAHHTADRFIQDAKHAIAWILGCSVSDLFFSFDRILSPHEEERMTQAFCRLLNGEPLAYICGFVDFLGLQFRVDCRVLIPRLETELFVAHLLNRFCTVDPLVVWDIGTGSGCIAGAIKKSNPHWHVSMSDRSSCALELACENIADHHLDVEKFEGDLLEPFAGRKADLIICNPPYISLGEYLLLDKSVRDWEPKEALCSGVTGLECYAQLAAQIKRFLHNTSTICLEIGSTQASAVGALFRQYGLDQIEVWKDLSGHDRYLIIRTGSCSSGID